MTRIKTLSQVVDWRLCVGCGACAYACPAGAVQLQDFVNEGIRPVVNESLCATLGCDDCLRVCPGVEADYRVAEKGAAFAGADYAKEWGPVVAMWEGHAVDPEIRYQGSSGGVITALAAYCVERGGMHGVLHIGADPKDPVKNTTRLSRTRQELLDAAGSRYAPASVCDRLGDVENAPAPCVIIGKPTEIAAVSNAHKIRPKLRDNTGLTISFFCAETPSTHGTLALLQQMGINRDELTALRYRGYGWPGHFAATCNNEPAPRTKMTYSESWAFLQAHRPWSAHLWPDGTGELADVSCGDPWYEEPDGKNPGFSLIVARTERGVKVIEAAVAAGYLSLKPAEAWKLPKSQRHLHKKKAATWGRQFVLRFFGIPVTKFPGMALRHCWQTLPAGERIRLIVSTARRVMSRKLYRPWARPVMARAVNESSDNRSNA